MKIASLILALTAGATGAYAHVGSHESSTHDHNWFLVGLVSMLMLGVVIGLVRGRRRSVKRMSRTRVQHTVK